MIIMTTALAGLSRGALAVAVRWGLERGISVEAGALCAATVGARFNFCPNCRCNLHPTCPQCKREVVEGDKYCASCGQDLLVAAGSKII